MQHRASDFTEFLERPKQLKEFKNSQSRMTVCAGSVLNLRERRNINTKYWLKNLKGKTTIRRHGHK